MKRAHTYSAVAAKRLQVLAEFRYALRQFLHFSEEAASKVNLQTRQHQLLLQIAGAPERTSPTVAYAAERLGLRHNSVVELADRCEDSGLLTRNRDPSDLRRVVLRLTAKGRNLLEKLSAHHARELNELGPRLIRSLKQIQAMNVSAVDPGAGEANGVSQ